MSDVPQRVVIATHTYATGPAQELLAHLRPRSREVLFLGSPLFRAPGDHSEAVLYRDGQEVRSWRGTAGPLPRACFHILDPLWVVRRVLAVPGAFDLFVGANPLNAWAGVVLRGLGKVRRCVHYTVDYMPKRFGNAMLNAVYHHLDRFCVRHCDRTWNLSPRMAEARTRTGLPPEHSLRQMVIPHGVPVPPRFDESRRNRHLLAFMGHLRSHQGIEDLLEAMPAILARQPQAGLLIIGGGEFLDGLRRRTCELGIEDHVEYTGFIDDHCEVLAQLARCAIGLAPYSGDPASMTWNADPGKPKAYVAAGLPVVITKVPYAAEVMERAGCALAVEPNIGAVTEAALRLLEDEILYTTMRTKAEAFATDNTWDRVFDRALTETMD